MKRLPILIIFIFTLSLGKTLLVPEEFLTIQSAVVTARNGDTISVNFGRPSGKRSTVCGQRINGKEITFEVRGEGKEELLEMISKMNTQVLMNCRSSLNLSRGWEGQRLVNRLDSVGDLTGDIACDQQSIPWVVWWGRLTQSSSDQIFFTRWNGTNWDNEQIVHPIDTFYNYRPSITFDNEDKAWVAWTREEGVPGHGDWEIFYTKWVGNGWDQKRQINPTNLLRKDFAEKINCGENEIWVVTSSFNRNMDSCAVFTSHWNGINWDTLIRVNSDSEWSWFSSIVVDNNGRPHIVWCEPISGRIYYRTRNDTGWTIPIWINDPSTVFCDDWAAPQITVDDSNNLHVVWVGIASGESDQDIFYSTYDGQQWAAPVRLNINDNYDEYYPDIALSSSNNIWVTWDKQLSFWVSHPYVKHFDGNSWSTEEKLDNDSISYFNASNKSALDQLGNPWVIWDGTTLGIDNGDIYYNRYISSGIEEKATLVKMYNLFNITPNPTSSRFNLELNRIDDVVLVYNLAGKLVKQVNWSKQYCQIDISNLPDGVYFLSSKHSNNKILSKVVKISR